MKIGDRVRMKAEFLRNTGQYTGNICHARGVVTGLKTLGRIMLAEVSWDLADVPAKVVVPNLEKCQ